MPALKMQPEALVIREIDAENSIPDTRCWLTGDKASCLLLRTNLYNEDVDRDGRQCGQGSPQQEGRRCLAT